MNPVNGATTACRTCERLIVWDGQKWRHCAGIAESAFKHTAAPKAAR